MDIFLLFWKTCTWLPNSKIDFDLTFIFQLLNLGFQRNSKVICVHFKSAFNVQGTPLWLLLHISPIKNERDIVVRTFSSSILSPLLSKPSRLLDTVESFAAGLGLKVEVSIKKQHLLLQSLSQPSLL